MEIQTSLIYTKYKRKSSEDNKERQAASLPEQEYALEGIKSKHNLNVVNSIEESKSAHKPGREGFEKMLMSIENGKSNAVLVWHPNRLCRNMTDGGKILDLMDTGKLLEIRTPSRTYHNTPEDKFMLTLEFGLSKKDSDDKSVVVKRGLEGKCRKGWRPGVAPQGYLNDKATESGFRRILTDPDRLSHIKKLFQLYLQGTPVKQLYFTVRDEWGYRTAQRKRSGGGPLSISMIYKILTNKFYTGRFEYPEGSGIWYDGDYERAITEEEFNQIQLLLGKRGKYVLRHHEYAYTSLIKCGYCQSSITAEEKHQVICSSCKFKFSITKQNQDICTKCHTTISQMQNPKILNYTYYRCTRRKNSSCKQIGIRVENLEKQIDQELSQIEIPQLFVEWAIKQLESMNEGEKKFREDTVASIKNAHDQARARLDNLIRLKISPGNTDGSMLTDEQFKSQKITLEQEIKGLESQLQTIDQRMLQVADDINDTFNFAADARRRFAEGDLKTKRGIAVDLGSHLNLTDKILLFEGQFPFVKIKEMKKEVPSIGLTLAPEENGLTPTKMEALWASIPSVLRGWESRPV